MPAVKNTLRTPPKRSFSHGKGKILSKMAEKGKVSGYALKGYESQLLLRQPGGKKGKNP